MQIRKSCALRDDIKSSGKFAIFTRLKIRCQTVRNSTLTEVVNHEFIDKHRELRCLKTRNFEQEPVKENIMKEFKDAIGHSLLKVI